jgi:hypothetical protein
MNGRMDLLQAEAVADLVDARTRAMQRQALAQLDGGLSRRLLALRDDVIHLEALLAYDIDFPEEDDGPIAPARIASAAERLHAALTAAHPNLPRGMVDTIVAMAQWDWRRRPSLPEVAQMPWVAEAIARMRSRTSPCACAKVLACQKLAATVDGMRHSMASTGESTIKATALKGIATRKATATIHALQRISRRPRRSASTPLENSTSHAATNTQSYRRMDCTPGVHTLAPGGEIVPSGHGVGVVMPCTQ